MTTLQEAARKALACLELYDHEDLASCEARHELRTALAQQREQQPVCHGCGIPDGDVHMSTCKSGKWPSRVSNGDTAAPAPQPASEMVANFIVSAVVIKDTSTGFNTQNKLYPVSAANSDEATGKALPLVTNDFPEHRLHTMCFIQTAPAPQVQECNRSRPHELMDGYCGLRAEIARLMNEKARRE